MKAPYFAAGLVVVSVAAVVVLSGVTRKREVDPPRAAASPLAATKVETPPFPTLEGTLWNLPNVDARLRVPEGWTVGRVGNDERMLRTEGDPQGGNMNLLLMPNVFGLSVDELLTENVEELAVNPDLHLEDRREMMVMGRKVLRFDYNGVPRNGGEPFRFVAVIWPRGRYQVALMTTVRAAEWCEVASEVDAALETLQIRWPARVK
ncbi:MAG TPA: hypothetical protein VM509_04350 [Planctomycetota bacterium]|nr:hypothetical protein [Planctomycetota bacterium]